MEVNDNLLRSLTFIAEEHGYIFLQKKSEDFMTFKNFKVLVEKEVGSLKQALRTDDGEEYNSHDFAQFCENHGIKHQLTNILYTSTKWCM